MSIQVLPLPFQPLCQSSYFYLIHSDQMQAKDVITAYVPLETLMKTLTSFSYEYKDSRQIQAAIFSLL